MTSKRKRCGAAVRAGRLEKARQFWDAAEIVDTLADLGEDDLVDAYITLCVHAGVAAADVICCARLGEHAQGDAHEEAIALLATADKTAARHLRTLLALKTRAGYSDRRSTSADRTRSRRAADALVAAAIAER